MDLALAVGRLDWQSVREELSVEQLEWWQVYDVVRGVSRERMLNVLSYGFASCSFAGVTPKQINPDMLRKVLIQLWKEQRKEEQPTEEELIKAEIQKRVAVARRHNQWVESGS